MTRTSVGPIAIVHARALRKSMTPEEVKLWLRLRKWRPQGHHFRRQVPIGPFIVDFACRSSWLVVEIDGEQHGRDDAPVRDAMRDRRLRELGWRVFRFWNQQVRQEFEMVLDTIWAGVTDPAYDPRKID